MLSVFMWGNSFGKPRNLFYLNSLQSSFSQFPRRFWRFLAFGVYLSVYPSVYLSVARRFFGGIDTQLVRCLYWCIHRCIHRCLALYSFTLRKNPPFWGGFLYFRVGFSTPSRLYPFPFRRRGRRAVWRSGYGVWVSPRSGCSTGPRR